MTEGCGKPLPRFKYQENVRILCEFDVECPEYKNAHRFLLFPDEARKIMEKIREEDYDILGFHKEYALPQSMIPEVMLVKVHRYDLKCARWLRFLFAQAT